MARTEVMDARDALVEAALAWDAFDRSSDGSPEWENELAQPLNDAVDRYRAAVAKQSVDDDEVYVQNNSRTADREAAAAAMIARPGWRRVIHGIIAWETRWGRGVSDRQLEDLILTNTSHGDVKFDEIAGRKVTHQTISSARHSLLDAGLITYFGLEIVEGRKHTLWRTTTHVR